MKRLWLSEEDYEIVLAVMREAGMPLEIERRPMFVIHGTSGSWPRFHPPQISAQEKA